MQLTRFDLQQSKDWAAIASQRGIPHRKYRERVADGMDPQRAATQERCNRWDGVESDAAVCREYGLNRMAIYHWRHRHPQSSDLPARKIAEIIVGNKRAGRGGRRHG